MGVLGLLGKYNLYRNKKIKCYVKYIPILLKTIGNGSIYIAGSSREVTEVVVTANPIGAV